MKTEQTIRFDYERAMRQADLLDAAAQVFTSDSLSTDDAMCATAAGWQAGAATSFRKKGAVLTDEITASAALLRKLAEDVRETARRIYNMEMRNLAIIQASAAT